jgi:hypothetical protein
MSGRARGFAVVVMLGGLSIGIATASLRPAPAQAQSADSSSGQIQNQPLAPPPGTNENRLIGPDTAGSDSANPGAPAAPEAPALAGAPSVAAPSQWVPQQQAQLTVLDKIYGSATMVPARVGVPFSIRFLTVTVLACWTRPPALPSDAAAYLQVTDSHAAPGSPPEFRGWIFKAEPALSNMDDPATDISVDGCG